MIQVELELQTIFESKITPTQVAEISFLFATAGKAYLPAADTLIKSFNISGHADQAEYGQDIICAAVTTLAATCITSLDDLAEITTLQYRLASGDIMCELPPLSELSAKQLLLSQVLLRSFCLGLEQIEWSEQAKAGNYIQVITVNSNRKR